VRTYTSWPSTEVITTGGGGGGQTQNGEGPAQWEVTIPWSKSLEHRPARSSFSQPRPGPLGQDSLGSLRMRPAPRSGRPLATLPALWGQIQPRGQLLLGPLGVGASATSWPFALWPLLDSPLKSSAGSADLICSQGVTGHAWLGTAVWPWLLSLWRHGERNHVATLPRTSRVHMVNPSTPGKPWQPWCSTHTLCLLSEAIVVQVLQGWVAGSFFQCTNHKKAHLCKIGL
jgi:hypothetical protein